MKRSYIFLFTLILSVSSYAQVGIRTATPIADLEVVSKPAASLTAGEFNGIIIPKVAVIPTTVAPSGTLIYLTAISGTNPIGFYFSNGTNYINVTDTALQSPIFFNTGTTTNASNTTANVSRTGNMSLGSSLNTAKLNVEVTSGASSTNAIGVRIDNGNTGTGADATYGIFTENRATATGTKYGIRNDVTSSGNSNRIGIRNEVRNSSVSAANNVIGIDNFIGATDGAGTTNFGIRSEIGTAGSNTNNYGVFSIARGADARNNYSGYFRGDKFAIRSEDDATGYDMPVTNGINGQVLTTNGAGVASWVNVNASKSIVRGNLATTWLSSTGSANPSDYLKIPFDNDPIDTKNEFDTTTNRFTALATGLYRVTVQVSSNDYDNGTTHGLAIYKGSTLVAQDVRRHVNIGTTSEDNINRSLSDIIQLNSGEFIEFRFNDNFATLGASSEKNYFTIQQL